MTLWQLVCHLDSLANGANAVPRTTSPGPRAAVPPISLLTAKTYLKLAKWLESYRSMVDLNLLREEGMCFPHRDGSAAATTFADARGRSNCSALLLTHRVSDDAILFAAEHRDHVQDRAGQRQQQSVQWLVGSFLKRATHARPVAVAEAYFRYGRYVCGICMKAIIFQLPSPLFFLEVIS